MWRNRLLNTGWQKTRIQPNLTPSNLSQNVFSIYITCSIDLKKLWDYYKLTASIYIEYYVEMIKSTLLWKLFESVKG